MKQLIDKLRQYSQDLVAYKMGCEFADAVNEAADAIEKLQAESSQLRKERDAAVETLKFYNDCDYCKHNHKTPCGGNSDVICEVCEEECICRLCFKESKWEWRGVQEGENLEST